MNKNKHSKKDLVTIKMSLDHDDDDDFYKDSNNSNQKSTNKSKTPVLDNFSKDITKLAIEGKVDPVIGRDKEIERISQILSRRKKNNPIIIGEPGCGKTSVVDGLALAISEKKVSRLLFDKRIVSLDVGSIVSGTKYRGMMEERIKSIISELENNKDVILFIDEIHTIIGAGGSTGSLDISNMFKPALARGEIQVIGATTLDEYRKHIEKDGALERRFQKVIIEPASEDESIIILNNIKDKYETYHNVHYTPEAIEACVKLTSRYLPDRNLPDKAIDAMDEVGSRIHISKINVPQEIIDIENKIVEVGIQKTEVVKKQKYEDAAKLRDVERELEKDLEDAKAKWEEDQLKNRQIVNESDVAEVVSQMSGIPLTKVSQSENKRLKTMFDELSGKVIGQDDALSKIVKSIQRSRMGMKDPNKPLICALMVGNSGVGKTEMAKQIAKYLFSSEDSLIRLDMSEYMEKIDVSKIIGSSAGYVGYEQGSAFLNAVRTKPYSVILLDEIEKAHPDIFNVFLQMMDDGHLTDSHGRKVSFKNCVILMTSNVGTRVLKDFGTGVGFNTQHRMNDESERMKSILDDELKKKFAPEFINRLDEVIYFNDLSKENINKILDLELSKSQKRLNDIGYQFKIDDKLRDYLCEVGYDPKYGARPLKRTIQKWVDDYITEFLLDEPEKGTTFMLSYNDDDKKTLIEILSE